MIISYQQKRRRAELVVDEVRGAGGSAVATQADLTDEAAVSAMFADVRAQFGCLEVLVLNAGGGMERGADPAMRCGLTGTRSCQLWIMRCRYPGTQRRAT